MAEERRLATYQKPQQSQARVVDLHDLRREMTTPTTDDMYSVNKKSRPGARIARALALESNISHKIIAYGKDDKQAFCHVRGWIGPEENPIMQVEQIVIERYDDLLRQAVFDAIDNGMYIPTGRRDNYGRLETRKGTPDWDMGPDGFPILKDKMAQFQLMKNHLNKIKFAERSVKGKAERNCIFTLLGKDDEGRNDEPEEIEEPSVTKSTPEHDDLEGFRNRIRALLLKAYEGNKDTARETFGAVCKTLGMDATAPADLTKVEDAKRVLEYIMAEMQKSRSAVEVEAEVDDEINGPITAEEEARFSHDE